LARSLEGLARLARHLEVASLYFLDAFLMLSSL
jgi:hypothetical protein